MGVFYVFFKKVKLQNPEGGVLKFTKTEHSQNFLVGIFC